MPQLSLADHIAGGLRTEDSAKRNAPQCRIYRNMKPEGALAVAATKGLGGSGSTSLATALSAFSYTSPFPQLFRGRKNTYIGAPGDLYLVDESTWTLTRVHTSTAQYPYNLQDVSSGQNPTGSARWEMADFGDVVVFVNGSCFVVHTGGTWLVDTGLKVTTALNHMGRLLLGGFDSFAHSDSVDEYYGWLTRGLDSTPTLGTLTEQHVWWSSIGAEDLFALAKFDPTLGSDFGDPLPDDVVTDGGFDAPGEWTYTAGQWDVTGSVADRINTTANEEITQDIGSTGGLYRIEVVASAGISGYFTVRVGTGVSSQRSTTGTHVAYVYDDGTGDGLLAIDAVGATWEFSSIEARLVEELRTDELYLMGQQGHRSMPWQGGVTFLRSMGDEVVVAGEDMVVLLSPVTEPGNNTPTFGMRTLLDEGAKAIGGSGAMLYLVDNNNVLYRIAPSTEGLSRQLVATRLGLSEMLDAIGSAFTVTYNPDRRETYVAGAGGTLIATASGAISFVDSYISGVAQVGDEVVWTHDDGDLTDWRIETDDIDMGTRLSKRVRTAQVQSNASDLTLRHSVRTGRSGDFATTTKSVGNAGLVSLANSGMDHRIRVACSTAVSTDTLQDVIIEYDTSGKKDLSNLLR